MFLAEELTMTLEAVIDICVARCPFFRDFGKTLDQAAKGLAWRLADGSGWIFEAVGPKGGVHRIGVGPTGLLTYGAGKW